MNKTAKWIIWKTMPGVTATILGALFTFFLNSMYNDYKKNFVPLTNSIAPQLYGLSSSEVNKSNVFNDFSYNKNMEYRATQFMWVDPYAKFHDDPNHNGNIEVEPIISAFIVKENSTFLYRIKFAGSSYGLNTAIRPKENKIHLVRDFTKIKISIKSFEQKSIGFRIRVVDEKNIHWAYGKYKVDKDNKIEEDKDKNLLISYETKALQDMEMKSDKNEFQLFEIPLDKDKWVHFSYDGPKKIDSVYEKNQPFQFISLIIIEVGFTDKGQNAVENSMSKLNYIPNHTGIIDIGKIWFE